MNNKKIFERIKLFNVMEWVVFIKIFENLSTEELGKYNLNSSDLNILKNTNWYSMVLDIH